MEGRLLRVLLLTPYYFPNIQSCAKLMHDLAVELRDLGHEVVLAAPDDALDRPLTVTREEGLTVLRVKTGGFRGVSRVRRALNEWRLSALMWRRAGAFLRAHPCRLIVNYSPTIFFGPLVARLKRRWGCPVYLVLRDLFPQWLVDAGRLRRGGLVHRFFRHYERRLYVGADAIGVESASNLDYLRRLGLEGRARLEVLRNWAPSARAEPATTGVRAELGIQDRVVFFYGGNLGEAQDAGCLVRLAAAMASRPEAFFLIVGDGSEAAGLGARAAALGLDNLRFLPPVDQATYRGLVAEADVGMLTLRRDLSSHNTPGKMLDYMALGKPMLAAVNLGNDVRRLVERHDAGRVCWNGDDEDLLTACLELLDDPELRRRQGANGRRLLAEVFSSRRAARQILALAGAGD